MATLPGEPASAARRAEAQRAGGLSPREREVAQLVAQGRSNREIAETLIVGVRTIETHVSSILAKLELSSRRQIAAWLAERSDVTTGRSVVRASVSHAVRIRRSSDP